MTMKLSAAIRLGSTLKPQGFGGFYIGAGSCAMGAAADAIGLDLEEKNFDSVWPEWRSHLQPPCPECGRDYAHRDTDCGDADIIVHLNDFHRWTRERIADFVETIEQQQPVESAVELAKI